MKLHKIIWIFTLLLLVLSGCSLKPLSEIQNSRMEEIKEDDSDLTIVGFSQLGSESDWRSANTKSIQSALTEANGFSLIYANGRQSQENQIKNVRSFIFQEVDYIVIAPVTENGWDTVLEEAREAGIPVIIVDRMINTKDKSLFAACVGTDKFEEGKKAGVWLEEYLQKKEEETAIKIAETTVDEAKENVEKSEVLKEKTGTKDSASSEKTNPAVPIGQEVEQINIVILEGTPDSTAQIGRTKGFESVAKNHAEWNILAHENGDFTKAKGKELMKQYLREFDDIDVLVSQNDDMTFGAIEAIREAGLTCGVNGKITIISFDAVREAFDLMEAGSINADIECNPLQGELIADIIERLKKGEKVEKVSYVDGKVFDAANAGKERIGRSY